MTEISRRALIGAAGAFAGLATGRLGGDQPTVGAEQLSPADLPAIAVLPTTLRSRDVRIARPGAEFGKRPERGAPALPHGSLQASNGETVGRFDTSHVVGGRAPIHLQTLEFNGSTVVGVGPANTEGTFTIVGTSGSLQARGSYTVRRIDEDLEFTFHTETGA